VKLVVGVAGVPGLLPVPFPLGPDFAEIGQEMFILLHPDEYTRLEVHHVLVVLVWKTRNNEGL
jgi:hypothetical protein